MVVGVADAVGAGLQHPPLEAALGVDRAGAGHGVVGRDELEVLPRRRVQDLELGGARTDDRARRPARRTRRLDRGQSCEGEREDGEQGEERATKRRTTGHERIVPLGDRRAHPSAASESGPVFVTTDRPIAPEQPTPAARGGSRPVRAVSVLVNVAVPWTRDPSMVKKLRPFGGDLWAELFLGVPARESGVATALPHMTEKRVLVPGPDHPITVTPAGTTVTVRLGGRVIAKTDRALVLQEASYPPVHYLPLEDVEAEVLRPSSHETYCPFKGDASYYSLVDGETVIDGRGLVLRRAVRRGLRDREPRRVLPAARGDLRLSARRD